MKTTRQLFATISLAVLYGTSALAQQNNSAAPSRLQSSAAAHFRNTSDPGDPGMGPRGSDFGPHEGPRFGPPGMWWKNPELVKKLALTDEQQKKMDDIFQQNRLQLIDLKANVEKQEALLEPMLAANPPDTNKVLTQIDHVAAARAELEKSMARMLLGIRGVLTVDQWTKLQAERPNFRRRFDDRGPGGFGPAGPRSNGFQGPGGPVND